jgi:hypothetical protein
MSLFTMGKKPQTLKPPSVSSEDVSSETPVEAERPGTSGTEILLTTNRRTANAYETPMYELQVRHTLTSYTNM